MPIHGELQVLRREGPQALDELQPRLERRGRMRVSQQLLDLLLVGDDLVLAFDRLAVIAERPAAGHRQRGQQEGGHQQPESQSPRRFKGPIHLIMPYPISLREAVWQMLSKENF